MELFQIKFEFNTVEDRLLLRIFEKESNRPCVEYRLWLTRRFVNLFISGLDRLIEEELAGDMQISPDVIDAMKKFQHEAAISKADFSTSYAADAEKCDVFTERPLLVVMLKINKKAKGNYILSLLNRENIGIHLAAGMDLIYTLKKMLLDSVGRAAWNKPLFQTKEEKVKTTEPPGYIS
jgi:hypothetical protein